MKAYEFDHQRAGSILCPIPSSHGFHHHSSWLHTTIENSNGRELNIGNVIPGIIVSAINIVIFTMQNAIIYISITPDVLNVAINNNALD